MTNADAAALPSPAAQRLLLILAGAFVLADGLLMLGAWHGGFAAINQAGRVLPDVLAECLTQAGDSLFALTLFLLLAWRRPALLWHAVLAALIATLLSHGLKALAAEPRPAAVLELDSFRQLGPILRRNSFPSGHTVTAFVSAGTLACYWRRAAPLLMLLALLVGASRVIVGAHWPVDVLAGAAIGLLSAEWGLRLAHRTPWGLTPATQWTLRVLLIGCALAQLLRKPEYELAQPMAVVLSLLALLRAAVGSVASLRSARGS